MLNKQVARMRRERALAYAFTHQNTWKNSTKSGSQTFMDANNPHWGWSWLERWMAARPNENQSVTITLDNADKDSSIKSVASRAMSEMIPRSKNFSPKGKTLNSRRASSPSMRKVSNGNEDSKSILSIQSEQHCNRSRRHSICGSIPSPREDESFTSSHSQSVPGYMAPTQAAKARARFSNLSPVSSEKTAKKCLSFSPSSKTVRRFSGPPKLESIGTKKDTSLA